MYATRCCEWARSAVATENDRFTAPQSTLAVTVWRFWTLLCLDERKVGCVPSVFHFLDRDELEGGRVNDGTLARGRSRVGAYIAKVSGTPLCAALRSPPRRRS